MAKLLKVREKKLVQRGIDYKQEKNYTIVDYSATADASAADG